MTPRGFAWFMFGVLVLVVVVLVAFVAPKQSNSVEVQVSREIEICRYTVDFFTVVRWQDDGQLAIPEFTACDPSNCSFAAEQTSVELQAKYSDAGGFSYGVSDKFAEPMLVIRRVSNRFWRDNTCVQEDPEFLELFLEIPERMVSR